MVFGFEIDPTKINIPHGETLAYKTGAIVPKMYLKDKYPLSDMGSQWYEKSKYPNKQGRGGSCTMGAVFATNLARWGKLPQDQKKKFGTKKVVLIYFGKLLLMEKEKNINN